MAKTDFGIFRAIFSQNMPKIGQKHIDKRYFI